jgi:hypothetical protein
VVGARQRHRILPLRPLRRALEASLHTTFASMFVVAALVALTAALVPKVVFAARRAPAE